ncbi:MAG: hypothetical protein V4448_09990 [Pseudomonadota bacterium]
MERDIFHRDRMAEARSHEVIDSHVMHGKNKLMRIFIAGKEKAGISAGFGTTH